MFRLKSIILFGILHRLVSTNRSSRWTGKLAGSIRVPRWMLSTIMRWYISYYQIDMEQFDIDLKAVKNFNEFFTRPLKPGVRKWENGICSPVDGRLLSYGPLEGDQIFQIKGIAYSQSVLTGQQSMAAGSFATIYLAPGDYHRVHAPFDMQISEITHIPGKLLSVSLMNVRHIPGLYNSLERVVLTGTNAMGKFHFVFVGAFNVGSIRLSFLPDFASNQKNIRGIRNFNSDIHIRKGEELGWFELGSTVVMLTEGAAFSSGLDHLLFQRVKLGQSLAKNQ